MPLSRSLLSPTVPLHRSCLVLPGRAVRTVAVTELRLIAGFCATREQALHLHADLTGHLRLQAGQAMLLAPAEIGSPRLQQCLLRWRGLRNPAAPAAPSASLLQAWWAGLLARCHAAVGAGPRQSRFDRAVQARLAQGLHAVVVQEPQGAYTCNYLLDAVREAGVTWCAEAPRCHRR